MKKKRNILIVAVLAVIVIIGGICLYVNRTKSVNSFITLDKVERIAVTDGNTGEVTEITDTTEKANLIASLKELKFKKKSSNENDGWLIALTLKEGSKEVKFTFIGESEVQIDGKDYKVSNVDETLTKYLNKDYK